MPHTPLAVANFFIEQAGSEGVDHLKLQKLVYCAQGWWLHTNGLESPLIEEEIEAWKHGPVIPSLYHLLKPYGWEPVTEPQSLSPTETPPHIAGEDDRKFLMWIWNRYRALDGWAMSALTHKRGTPWHNLLSAHGYPPSPGMKIGKDAIQSEFKSIADSFRPAPAD